MFDGETKWPEVRQPGIREGVGILGTAVIIILLVLILLAVAGHLKL